MRAKLSAVVGTVAAVVVALALLFYFVGSRKYLIPSSAMEPTLHCDDGPGCRGGARDRILVPRWNPFWEPARGDIVAYEAPAAAFERCGARGTYVHRIVGLPGETLREDARGRIFVDGEPLHEPYVARGGPPARGGRWRVPAGSYFVMGDNRGFSCDSRFSVAVPRDNIIGEVLLRYWPLSRLKMF